MSAPRVPAGWTREAADLVWEDWRAALIGGDSSPLCMGSDIDPSLCHALESTGFVSGWTYPHPDHPSEFCYIGGWKSPEARLRAWAAVGAPVLAPAEDGRPSLAEWVAAAESSAFGQTWLPLVNASPQNWRMYHHGVDVEFAGNGAVIRRGDVPDEVWCTTPAELRAALDALAVKP